MKTIEEYWQSYRDRVLTEATPDQAMFARMCFWAGAGGMNLLITDALMMDAEPARVQFEALQAEINANFAAVAAAAQEAVNGAH